MGLHHIPDGALRESVFRGTRQTSRRGAGKPTRPFVVAEVVEGSGATAGRISAAGGVEPVGSLLVTKGS